MSYRMARDMQEYIEAYNKRVANMTLKEAIEVVSRTCSHYGMSNQFEKAVQMLIDCAEKEAMSKDANNGGGELL